MASPLTDLNAQASLEQQFFLILEKLSDLQLSYAALNPTATPIQILTAYARDHLSGVITGSFTFESTTNQEPVTGKVIVIPATYEFV